MENQTKLIIAGAGGLMAIALFLSLNGPSSNNDREIQITGVATTVIADRGHVDGEVDYQQIPPVGGDHSPVWLSCNGDIYDEQVVNENAVHSLEHGAVWITYQPDLDSSQIKTLEDKVKIYTFMSPYPEQEPPIMLSAWGVQLAVDSADDPRIDQFLSKYRQGSQTPEPGATCNAIPGGMQ